jgi:tetratricopeptide (TPR) repeat protein
MKKQRGAFGGGGKARHGERPRVVRPAQSVRSFGRSELLIAAALAVAILAVYGQVISHQFINLDDDLYIWDNPMVGGGLTLKGIAWAFTTFHSANWHPLTWLSHMIDSQLFGLNAGGHLFVNALIHVSNTLLLFFFLRRVTGARWRSAIVAALFALHPLHVESVAWAAERKDTLSTFFGLLCLLAYARYVEKPSRKKYALVAVWLALGLMAKPMLVSWPFVLLLLDYWPLRRLEWRPANGIKRFAKGWLPLVREKLPLFCLVVPSMVVTYIAQAHWGAVAGLIAAPLSWRLANSLVSYAKYLLLTFWPEGLAIYYPFSHHAAPAWQWVAALILLGAITAVALRNARERSYLIVGWLWFLGTLVPVIGLVKVGDQAMADRYTYIPSIGLFIALVFGLADLANTWRIGRVSIATASAVTILLLASLTTLQISRWCDSETLFAYVLSVTSNNLLIQNHLGSVLNRQGKHAEAIPHFAEALRIKPDFFDALANMGLALRQQGKAAEAIGFYKRALRVKPDSAKAHWQLGLALADQGKNDGALQEFLKAMELAPNDFNTRMDLGLMLMRQGNLSEATSQLNEALRLKPDSAEAHNNLGLVLLMAGQPEKSLPYFSAALRLKPNFTVARDNLRRAQRQIDARQK